MQPPSPHLRPCPCCGGPRAPWGPLPPDRLSPRAASVSLVRCGVCGTLESVLPGGPGEAGAPEGAYLPHAAPAGITGLLARRGQRRKAAVTARLAGSEGKLVDVGCGSGGFLEACRRRWPDRELAGTEPDRGAADLASERGFEVHPAPLEEMLPEPVRGAGVYTMWHVLEHLDDPGGALERLREGLTSEGRIIIAVPNARAWERALWGRHTVSWDPPRHRWHFTPRGLEELARSAGLRTAGRFTLISDDVYDAASSVRWLLYRRAWTDPDSLRGRSALLGGAAAAPVGLLLGLAVPREGRASLGYVLEVA